MSIVLYSDFTSAECYALNEQVASAAGIREIAWRGVQTDPGLPEPMRALDRRAFDRLDDELSGLARRVPGLLYATPKGKPNTARAILALASVTRFHAARSAAYRDAIFRAYWRHGSDISRIEELQRLADGAGVPRWVELDHPDAAEDAANWELDWQTERLGGVPRAIRSDGQLFWGVRSAAEVTAFFGA